MKSKHKNRDRFGNTYCHAPRVSVVKCVQRIADGAVKRVRVEAADDMVRTGGFKFVPKSIWKKGRGDVKASVENHS